MKRNNNKDSVDKFEYYIMRVGAFYVYLESKSKCIHWGNFFALSDTLDTSFYEECDHDHTETDVTVEK